MKKLFLFLAAYIMMLPAMVNAQPQIKENIDEIKAKVNGFATSLATIKANTDGLADMVKNLKSKSEIFSPDFLSGDVFERLKDGLKEFKDNIKEETDGIKKFRGADFKCGPGSECFKFKKDIADIFSALENLNKAILGPNTPSLGLTDMLSSLIEKSPGLGLYPVYQTMGPWIITLSKNLSELSQNMEKLADFAKSTSLETPGIFKGSGPRYYDKESFLQEMQGQTIMDSYIQPVEIKKIYSGFSTDANLLPDTNNTSINSNLATIELGKFCKDRPVIGHVLNTARVGLKFVTLWSKVMQEAEGKEAQVGGSFFGHAAFSVKIDPAKKIGILTEGLCDIIDQILDNVSGNLDMCDNMRAAKAIADNQKTIADNQKILFDMLSNQH